MKKNQWKSICFFTILFFNVSTTSNLHSAAEKSSQKNLSSTKSTLEITSHADVKANIEQALKGKKIVPFYVWVILGIMLLTMVGVIVGSYYLNNVLPFSIRQKIIFQNVVLILSFIFTLVINFDFMRSVDKEITNIAEIDLPVMDIITKIEIHQLEQVIQLERAMKYASIELTEDNRENITNALNANLDGFNHLSQLINKEVKDGENIVLSLKKKTDDTELIEKLEKTYQDLVIIEKLHHNFEAQGLEVMNLLQASDSTKQNSAIVAEKIIKLEKLEDELDHKIENLLTEILVFTEQAALIAEMHQHFAVRFMIGLLIFITIAGIALSSLLASAISKPLKMVLESLNQIAYGDGDLRKRIDIYAKDETGVLSKGFNKFIAQMDRIIGLVKQSAETVSNGSKEIKKGSEDLSQRTEQQAAAIEEAATTMELMLTRINENAKSAKQADNLSNEAADKLKEGASIIHEVVQNMEGIRSSSDRVSEIINVINNIAFQTNLLALNASIEAARAGVHGRGFAVVAVEVRKLAKESDDAAKQIAELISDNNSKVSIGNDLVDRAGKSLDEINKSMGTILSLVSNISKASQEQRDSANQINTTVSSLNTNTQQNAALVEETFATAEAFTTKTDDLYDKVSQFKVSEDIYNSEANNDTEERALAVVEPSDLEIETNSFKTF